MDLLTVVHVSRVYSLHWGEDLGYGYRLIGLGLDMCDETIHCIVRDIFLYE